MKLLSALAAITVLASFAFAEMKAVPVRIDFSYYSKSSLAIEYKSEKFDVLISKLGDIIDSPDEKAFLETFKVLQHNDIKNFEALIGVDSEIKTLFKNYGRAISWLEKREPIKLQSKIFAGDNILFLWGNKQQMENGEIKSYFCKNLFSQKDGQWKWSTEYELIFSVLNHVEEEHKDEPDKYIIAKDISFKYEIPIYPASAKNQIILKFNGEKHDFDVFNDPAPKNKVLAFYQKALNGLADRPGETYAKYYTEGSAKKTKSSIDKKGQDQFKAERQDSKRRGRIVHFVMDIDPVYIIYFKQPGVAAEDLSYMSHEYVVDVPGKGLRLTNLYYHDSLDQLFNSEEFRMKLKKLLSK